ncbi:MAG: minor capsid protein [Erysipelotrichaceae bacterium]
MMKLSEVRDWLKTFLSWTDAVCIGKMDKTQEKAFCVYGRPDRSGTGIAVGGLACTPTAVKKVSLIIRYGKYANLAEEKAQAVYAALLGAAGVTIGGSAVAYISLTSREPIPLDTDESGVYEYVIEMDIVHERS